MRGLPVQDLLTFDRDETAVAVSNSTVLLLERALPRLPAVPRPGFSYRRWTVSAGTIALGRAPHDLSRRERAEGQAGDAPR